MKEEVLSVCVRTVCHLRNSFRLLSNRYGLLLSPPIRVLPSCTSFRVRVGPSLLMNQSNCFVRLNVPSEQRVLPVWAPASGARSLGRHRIFPTTCVLYDEDISRMLLCRPMALCSQNGYSSHSSLSLSLSLSYSLSLPLTLPLTLTLSHSLSLSLSHSLTLSHSLSHSLSLSLTKNAAPP